MKRIVFVALVISSLVSCRSTKQIGAAIAKRDTVVQVTPGSGRSDSAAFIREVVGGIARNRINFTTFSAKVNVDYRGGDGKNYDVNATIRMIKDSAIWISANAVLGIEAIRVLVTRDSVKLMNKLEKTYTARSIDYLQEVTELPLGLDILQDLLIGNPVYLDSNVVSYARSDNSISIISLGQWFKNQLTVGEPGKAVQRIKLDDADVSRSRTAELTYNDYESNKGPLFATKRRITVSDKKKLDISLDFKNYDLGGEVSFPFSVPKNFKRN
ncbi:MAG TPA: DUF4292 domain-containing protein [Flavisolibacter sp.]|jgi:hypothetical protein